MEFKHISRCQSPDNINEAGTNEPIIARHSGTLLVPVISASSILVRRSRCSNCRHPMKAPLAPSHFIFTLRTTEDHT